MCRLVEHDMSFGYIRRGAWSGKSMSDKDDLPVGIGFGLRNLGFALVVFTRYWTFVSVRD
jgi:hypothetical protein